MEKRFSADFYISHFLKTTFCSLKLLVEKFPRRNVLIERLRTVVWSVNLFIGARCVGNMAGQYFPRFVLANLGH